MQLRMNVRQTKCSRRSARAIARSRSTRVQIPQPEDSKAIAMEAGSEVTLPLPREERASMLIRDDDPRQLIVSADTRESIVAAYLDAWKRRIEAVGAAYLPELGDIGGISGSPTLAVSIEASGDLGEAVIRKTSGSTVLDLAALDILQRASPFNPFPPEIAAEYDTVRFEYKWLFAEQLIPTAANRRLVQHAGPLYPATLALILSVWDPTVRS